MNATAPTTDQERYTQKVLEAVIRISVLILLAVWSFKIFSPFLGPVVWGVIIAIACNGLYLRLRSVLGGGSGLAATVFVVLALAILITPTVLLSESLLNSAQHFTQQLESGKVVIPPPPERVETLPLVGQRAFTTWSLASNNLEEALERFRPQIEVMSKWMLGKALGTGVNILLFALSIIISGLFLAHGDAGARLARQFFARLGGERGEQFVMLARDTVISVARGVLGIAVLQTLFLSVGMIAAGVPAAGLLSVLTLLVAVAQLPMLLLFLPIIVFVFATSDPGVAIPFAIWSVFFSFADGFLKPLLLGRGLLVPMPVILIGVIGGMLARGIIGLFVGPIVLAFSYVLFRLWLESSPGPTAPAPREAAGGNG